MENNNPNNLYTYMDLRTSHITPEASEYLKQQSALSFDRKLTVYEYTYGYWLYAYPDKKAVAEVLGEHDVPACLRQIILKAHTLGASWIKLDGDGFEHEDLPMYEW